MMVTNEKRPGSSTLPDREALTLGKGSNKHPQDTTLRFSPQRVRCPYCDARRGFAPIDGRDDAGKCHACGLFIPPGDSSDYLPRLRLDRPPTVQITAPRRPEVIEATSWRLITTYDYRDEAGRALFHVDRLERHARYGDAPDLWRREKSFRQWHAGVTGQRINDLHGVRRVLYELPAVLSAIREGRTIWIVEGEKDADVLNDWFRHEIGSDVATTAPGGACKWRTEYSESLRGADVILWGDADDAGQRHIATLRQELPRFVSRLRVIPPAAFQRKEERP